MSIWVPPTYRDRGLAEARRAVKDYDSELDFGLNERTGQYCVFIPKGTNQVTMENDLPILGFNEIPTREQVQKRLYESDARRRGYEILDSIQKHNDSIQKEHEQRAAAASSELAETAEWAMRMMGNPNAPVKVFMRSKSGS